MDVPVVLGVYSERRLEKVVGEQTSVCEDPEMAKAERACTEGPEGGRREARARTAQAPARNARCLSIC